MATKSSSSVKSAQRRSKAKRPAHPWAGARVAVDRQSVIVEFLPGSGAKGRLVFSRDELANFMRFLAKTRREMPRVPPIAPDDFKEIANSNVDAFDARWWLDLLNDFSASRITFDHPGYGHVRFLFPPIEARKIIDVLISHQNKIDEHKRKQTK